MRHTPLRGGGALPRTALVACGSSSQKFQSLQACSDGACNTYAVPLLGGHIEYSVAGVPCLGGLQGTPLPVAFLQCMQLQRAPLLTVAFSGSRLSNQIITDTKFSAPEAHIIPAVKFTFTLVGAALRRPPRVVASPSQRRLMALIGLLDASAYTVYCLGSSCCSLRCCCRPA